MWGCVFFLVIGDELKREGEGVYVCVFAGIYQFTARNVHLKRVYELVIA